jgi:hypothetical protein
VVLTVHIQNFSDFAAPSSHDLGNFVAHFRESHSETISRKRLDFSEDLFSRKTKLGDYERVLCVSISSSKKNKEAIIRISSKAYN